MKLRERALMWALGTMWALCMIAMGASMPAAEKCDAHYTFCSE
jgi:hypothetical protein